MTLALIMLMCQEGVVERFKERHGDFLLSQYRKEHAFQVGWLVQPETEIEDVSGDVDIDILWLQAHAPVPVSEDTYAVLGLRFENRRYNRSGSFGMLDEDETFTVMYAVLGASTFVDPDLLVSGFVGLGLASDLDESLEGDDFRIRGRLLVTGRVNARVFWKLGLDVSEQDDRARLIPLIGGALQINDKVRVDALLPKWLLVTWEAAERVYLAVGWDLTGEEYHRHSASDVEGDFRVDDYRFFIEARYYPIEKAGVWGRIGISTGVYELETSAGSFDEWQEFAIFFEVGLSFDLF